MGSNAQGPSDLIDLFAATLDAVDFPVLVHDESTIVYCNQATRHVLHATSSDDLVGKPIGSIVHPDGVDAGRERRRVMLDQGHAFAGVAVKLVAVDGTLVHQVAQGRKFLIGDHAYIVVISPDDPAAWEWSAPLGAGVLSFPPGTSLDEAIFRALPHPVFVADRERIRVASHAGAMLLGADSAYALEGSPVAAYVHQDVLEAANQRRAVMIDSGMRMSQISTKLLRADGNTVYVELEARPVPLEGSTLGVWWLRSAPSTAHSQRPRD